MDDYDTVLRMYAENARATTVAALCFVAGLFGSLVFLVALV